MMPQSSPSSLRASGRALWPGLLAAALTGALLYAAVDHQRATSDRADGDLAGLDAGERAAYLEAVSLASRPGPRDLTRARDLLEPLAERDPPHAPALVHWADVQLRLEPRSPAGPIRSRLARALRHDPGNAMAFRVLGDFALYRQGHWRNAALAYRQALALDPDDAAARVARARLQAMHAQFDGAISDLRAAARQHPGSMSLASDLGWFYTLAGRHQDALRACESLGRLEGTGRRTERCFLDVHLDRGDRAAAVEHAIRFMHASSAPAAVVEEIAAMPPAAALDAFHRWEIDSMIGPARRGPGAAVWLAMSQARLGQWTLALDWLERAAERGEREVRFAAVIPAFRPLHAHPRFQRLLHRLHLPPPASIALPRPAGGTTAGKFDPAFSVLAVDTIE